MVRLATLILSLACSALASPFVKPSDGSLERRKLSSLSASGAEVAIHERVISKAITKPAIVCDLTCKACLAKPAPKKGKGTGKGKGKGNAIPRSLADRNLALEERSLDDIEDLWGTDASAANEYVMEQIDSVAGKDDELDWNLIQHDAVSGQGSWSDKPLRKYIRGLMGCTGIVIVSDKGYWFAHFMETGFLDRGDNWKNKIIKPLQQGTNKFITPRSLAKSGGILNKANNVKIYVSTPRTKTSTEQNPVLLYKAKVDELLSHITGRGEPLNGVQVITRGYLKPESEAELEAFHNRANGKVLVEYDNNQLDANGNQPNPKERMYRVWLEHKYYEHRFR
ncbi:uncharacterized protein BKA55DRAFT_522168 [Fusarium redolens]|uniref:Uncharacterized protein n=1 Tax=Fusarium redolens TaxID=48865 RepID=A0A9P9JZQ5_FUSRE|nr:uncharacterized protein BKA55DRAFT_522168 [Fusarium redolens]KAH7234824.1 hypothetical protein BKA55DRAFT_522168 [Fusarium redolens]